MEIWDAYDQDFHKIPNVTLVRGESIPDGMFHLVCEVLVRHVDGTYLLMQRDPRKSHGGMWEASAGGSALQGETPLTCAIRELREETGITSGDFTELGQVISPTHHAIYVEFLCVADCDHDRVVLQEGETVAYRWVGRDALVHMNKSELVTKRIQKFLSELQ